MPRLVPPAVLPGSLAAGDQPELALAGGGRLRAFRDDDAEALVQAFADPDIQRWHFLQLDSAAEAQAWIAAAGDGWAAESAVTWAVVDDADRLRGRISCYLHDLRSGLAELSYWVVPEARGRGVAGRAVSAVSAWAFDRAGLHRIEVNHSVHNPVSCRVATAAGYPAEGTRRKALRHADGWHDVHVHVLLAADPVEPDGRPSADAGGRSPDGRSDRDVRLASDGGGSR